MLSAVGACTAFGGHLQDVYSVQASATDNASIHPNRNADIPSGIPLCFFRQIRNRHPQKQAKSERPTPLPMYGFGNPHLQEYRPFTF